MDLSQLFLYSGRFLITIYLIAIFIISVIELSFQSSAALSTDISNSQMFLNNVLQNINAKPITSLSLADPNTDCSEGTPIALAYYETGFFCECNSTQFSWDICNQTQINQGCTSQKSKELSLNNWKQKEFCQITENYWNYSSSQGTCEQNMTICEGGICVRANHTCPLTEMTISDISFPSDFINLGNITINQSVWITNSSNSTPIIDIYVNNEANSTCINGKLIFNNNSENRCLSYQDEIIYKTLDFEMQGSLYSDNNLTERGDVLNSSNFSVFLLFAKKISVVSDGYCASLNGMKNLTIYYDFSDFDNYRDVSVLVGIVLPAVGCVLFFIYVFCMRRKINEDKKNKGSFLFFWTVNALGIVGSIVILIYDNFSYDFLNELDQNNNFLYEIEAGNCFGEDTYQNFFTVLVEDIKNYYSERESCMDVGLVFCAAYIVFEIFYLFWFGLGYGCKPYIKKEEEVELTEKEDEEE